MRALPGERQLQETETQCMGNTHWSSACTMGIAADYKKADDVVLASAGAKEGRKRSEPWVYTKQR